MMKNQRTDIEKGKLIEDEKKIKTDDIILKKWKKWIIQIGSLLY